ncbi:cytochrome c [Telluribacter sp. SYSU D00476]|uniref:c-type cytochrome n=1 Tax=Telluribacter sp. SYSU D00476 TaxID=2811430 RepID=UPI001FF49E90|nr:cytochrome c [Telluribacter sp. SYSU D00476]
MSSFRLQRVAFFALGVLVALLTACQSSEELKRDQYYSEGYQLYTTYCANCHQADGKGLANLYPPLAGSEYLADKSRFICITRYGMSGEITVAGKTYNRPMPANPNLKDLEIAEIATYVYNTWGKDSTYTNTEMVTEVLSKCEKQ